MKVYCCFENHSDNCTYNISYLEEIFLDQTEAELWVIEKEEENQNKSYVEFSWEERIVK